eukprot:scaffold106092_cov60-Phaeocystis_antarctica.AAC.2
MPYKAAARSPPWRGRGTVLTRGAVYGFNNLLTQKLTTGRPRERVRPHSYHPISVEFDVRVYYFGGRCAPVTSGPFARAL